MKRLCGVLLVVGLCIGTSTAFARNHSHEQEDKVKQNKEESEHGREDKKKENKGAKPGKARFSTPTGMTTPTSAKADIKVNIKPKRKGDEQRFTVKLKIPLPDTFVQITEDNASAAAFRLTVTRAQSAVAQCQFQFRGIEEREEDVNDTPTAMLFAEYAIDLMTKRGRTTKRVGVCDIDLATTGVQKGIPSLVDGDILSISWLDTQNEVTILNAEW